MRVWWVTRPHPARMQLRDGSGDDDDHFAGKLGCTTRADTEGMNLHRPGLAPVKYARQRHSFNAIERSVGSTEMPTEREGVSQD